MKGLVSPSEDNIKPLMVYKPRRLTHITRLKLLSCLRLYLGKLYDLFWGTGNDSSSGILWKAEKDNSLSRRSWQKMSHTPQQSEMGSGP